MLYPPRHCQTEVFVVAFIYKIYRSPPSLVSDLYWLDERVYIMITNDLPRHSDKYEMAIRFSQGSQDLGRGTTTYVWQKKYQSHPGAVERTAQVPRKRE